MTTKCPRCESETIETKNYAKKAGGTIGLVGGAASGIASAMSGAEIGAVVGATVGFIGGPIGSRIGSLAGAIVGGLIGGAAGCVTGAKLGHVIDEQILDNYHCLDCDYHFSLKRGDDVFPLPPMASK